MIALKVRSHLITILQSKTSQVSTIKHINEFQVEFFLVTEYSNQRYQNYILYYIYVQSKNSDTYEHSIHDHRFHLQFPYHRIFESKCHKYQVHYISQSEKDSLIVSTVYHQIFQSKMSEESSMLYITFHTDHRIFQL